MPVTPANRDALRERAFALSAQGIGVRKIASTLGINKDTAAKLVREERQRRSHDRDAEEEVRRAIASLRTVLTDLQRRYDEIEGTSPHSQYARVKTAEQIRRTARDLVALYGVELPETDGERILDERHTAMMNQPLPEGFPEVGEQAAVEKHLREMESEFFGSNWEDAFDDRGGYAGGYADGY
jgi:hypothetical protein